MLVSDIQPAQAQTVGDSGVSWSAVTAGGLTAAAISIILLLFGTGLGLASVSPWQNGGLSVGGFTALAAIFLIIVQWVSAAFGGYIAGRLRTKWSGLHTDEVFFRDTAHGFLAWSLATVIVVTVVAVSGGAGIKEAAQDVTASAGVAAQNNYFVDELFRENTNPAVGTAPGLPPQPSGSADSQLRLEAETILAHSAVVGQLSPADNAYLSQLVSAHTGLASADAQARVSDVVAQENAAITKAKQAADTARKASAQLAIYTFVSMLIGAFIASVAGAIGGRLRDAY